MISQYRRFFSVLFVKVQAACLTARLGHLGMGAREAAGRRRDLLQQEQSSRREGQGRVGGRQEARQGRAGWSRGPGN